MATGGQQKATCKIVQDRILELETEAGSNPNYRVIVLMQDKLLVTDYGRTYNLQLFNCHDGKRLSASEELDAWPSGVCVLNDTEVSVCLMESKIVVLTVESINDVKRVKTLNLSKTGFNFTCHSVVKWNSDKIIVSGWNSTDSMLYWCIVSVEQESLESTHVICKVKGGGCSTYLAVKEDKLYVSCQTYDSNSTGVYFFDVLKPEKPAFFYQHQELKWPGSVMADMFYVYVNDWRSYTIHQLTFNGKLDTIHKMSSKIYRMLFDDRHGDLYTISYRSNVITVYRIEYPHLAGIPLEILKMDDRSISRFEEALKDGKETVHSIRIMVVGALAVGKSTLVKRLLGESVNISERAATEGIDVYCNCCDVSLSTHEWTIRSQDSEQDYKLQRLVKVLNENYQTRGRGVDLNPDAISSQKEGTKDDPLLYVAADDKNINVQDPNMAQNNTSTSSLEGKPSSTLVHMAPEMKLVEMFADENDKVDPLRELLKLLQQNPDKAKQDVVKYAHLTMLDFAGQYAFYTTHQMFLASRAIYLLVTDSSKDASELVTDDSYFDSQGKQKCIARDLVEIWMNSIHSCSLPVTEGVNSANSAASSHKITPPPVILVGTHIDQISENQQRTGIAGKVVHQSVSPSEVHQEHCRKEGQKYLKKIRKFLKDKPTKVHLVDGDFAIDNSIVDSELEKLKEKIVEVASQLPYWGEQIPTRWFLLEQQLMMLKDAGLKVISHIDVEKLNNEGNVQIKTSDELELFLKYLHETGTIIYFSIEVLRDNVVLDPKWLIDALKSLINAQPNLPTNSADNGTESNLPTNSADNGTESNRPTDNAAHNDLTQKWINFKSKGILTSDIVDSIWTNEAHPELHAHKTHILMLMEQFSIIAKPRSFNEMGEKVENYFLTPCMLRQESPADVISPDQDPSRVTTPEISFIFTGKYLPTPIFHRLLAACVARWPVAKKESESLIFCGCCVFDLDLFHRLTVYLRGHIICAKITRLVIDEIKTNDIKTPDAKVCSKVRRFIILNLDKIISYLGQNLTYALQAEHKTWFADEGPDPDTSITPEHMNHARLCVALATVCGKAMRDILRNHFDAQYTDIYHAILANKGMLTTRPGRGNPLLNPDQIKLVFPQGQRTGLLEQFDISLLYTLIRNISSVRAPSTGWGCYPQDQTQRDTSLGASVERIRYYRNHISGHSPDVKINHQDLQDYWHKFEAVLHDIETAIGGHVPVYRQELEKQRRQVISIYEAC